MEWAGMLRILSGRHQSTEPCRVGSGIVESPISPLTAHHFLYGLTEQIDQAIKQRA